MSTEAPKYLNDTAVKSVLTWPLVNEAVEEAFKAVSKKTEHQANASTADQPLRSFTKAEKGVMLTFPGYIGNYKLRSPQPQTTLACKIVTSFGGNEKLKPPLPSILANIMLFNIDTGHLECIVEGTEITAWRTASASIVATKYLYYKRLNKDIKAPVKLAIIGCGTQGRSHALGMCSTFNVQEVQLWNRTVSKAELLAADLKNVCSKTTDIFVAASPTQAVANADIICVGTSSAQALVTLNMLPKKKLHINSKGNLEQF